MVIVMVVSVLLIGWTRLTGTTALLRLGVLWALLTFVFEIIVGLLRGLDAGQLWTEINPLAGGLMLYSLAVLLLAPLAARRLKSFGRKDAT